MAIRLSLLPGCNSMNQYRLPWTSLWSWKSWASKSLKIHPSLLLKAMFRVSESRSWRWCTVNSTKACSLVESGGVRFKKCLSPTTLFQILPKDEGWNLYYLSWGFEGECPCLPVQCLWWWICLQYVTIHRLCGSSLWLLYIVCIQVTSILYCEYCSVFLGTNCRLTEDCVSMVCIPHLYFSTGTLFWKWGFCPQNTVSNFLEVSAGDPDFKNVIAPAALSALSLADSISPVAGCAFVRTQHILIYPSNGCSFLGLWKNTWVRMGSLLLLYRKVL